MPLHETHDTVFFIPDSDAKCSLIWCHGLGADGHDFVPLAEALSHPNAGATRFVFPHAPIRPVTINQGYEMRAWFDIRDIHINASIDEAGIEASKARVADLIRQEIAEGIPAQHIFLGGFSQGAVMALIAGLTFPETLGGIIALSGFLPHAEAFLKTVSPANQHTRVFIGHGTDDAIVPHALGTAAKDALLEARYPVTWKTYAMGHSVCPQEIDDLSVWLSQK